MNVVQAVQDYITKMITNIPGMKVLLLDKETTGIVSMVYTQSQILQKEVYLFERLDAKNREFMAHLKAVTFVRPTQENLSLLEQELKEPKYGEYHIFFSNTVKNSYIEELADADEHETVQQLQEFFADYYAVNSDLLTLNLPGVISVHQPDWRNHLDRMVDGLASCLLSLKKQPFIRYSGKSDMAQKTVNELQRRIAAEPGLFDFRKQDIPPLLLVLDRRDDPVTPLLTQWTYQAMVHELLGIKNGRVDLSNAPGVRKDLQEIVLSAEQDPWYKQCMYLNFGDLGVKIKELVDDFQSKTKSNQSIQSIEDIKRFVEDYPLFKKLSGNVTKHVTLMGELSRFVDERQLLKLSEVEQELANNHSHDAHLKAIKTLFTEPKIRKEDILKIVLLYAMRYEDDPKNEITQFIEYLNQIGVPAEQRELISAITQYASSGVRTGDVFRNKSKINRGIQLFRRGLNGVENIYMEHKPLLKEILDNISTGRLRDIDYPFALGGPTKDVPQEIIVFVVGGVTYEEALTVHEFNSSGSGVRVILGGSFIHNSKSFLEDVAKIRTLSFR